MLKGALLAAASTFAVAFFATATTGPAAMAAAPKCKSKANQYVACTDRLTSKTRRTPKGEVNPKKWIEIDSTGQRKARGLKN
jgi:hypothetical protein